MHSITVSSTLQILILKKSPKALHCLSQGLLHLCTSVSHRHRCHRHHHHRYHHHHYHHRHYQILKLIKVTTRCSLMTTTMALSSSSTWLPIHTSPIALISVHYYHHHANVTTNSLVWAIPSMVSVLISCVMILVLMLLLSSLLMVVVLYSHDDAMTSSRITATMTSSRNNVNVHFLYSLFC